MFEDNIFMRMCAGLGLIFTTLIFICSFIPALQFEREVPKAEEAIVRIIGMIMIIGFIRGAF